MTQDSAEDHHYEHIKTAQDSTEGRHYEHVTVINYRKDKTINVKRLIVLLRDYEDLSEDAPANYIKELKAKLAKAVEAAFCEGFAEGYDGDWVEGDYTHAWKESEALDNLERMK
jgi:hypothetical protein